MLGHFHRALDVLIPAAQAAGTQLLIENMPFAFLPDAEALLKAIDSYGNADLGILYDVANAHFIGEDIAAGLRTVRKRLSLVHFSDTTRAVYRHDPFGKGDVSLDGLPAVIAEIGYQEVLMLEIISSTPDTDIANSAHRLRQAGFA